MLAGSLDGKHCGSFERTFWLLSSPRPHLGATRPRVGICLSRLDALTSKYISITNRSIANLGYRPQVDTPTGDASPPEDAVRTAAKGTLEAATMLAGSLDGKHCGSFERTFGCSSPRPHLGATRPRVGICLSRLDALTSKYISITNRSIANLGYRPPS